MLIVLFTGLFIAVSLAIWLIRVHFGELNFENENTIYLLFLLLF